jgi:hypothetical protein
MNEKYKLPLSLNFIIDQNGILCRYFRYETHEVKGFQFKAGAILSI